MNVYAIVYAFVQGFFIIRRNYGKSSKKEQDEQNAINKLSSNLPPDLKDEFESLFQEYESQTTPEAKAVKKADKIMPLIQSLCTMKSYSKSDYHRFKITSQEVQNYLEPFFDEDDIFKDLYSQLLDECEEQNIFYKNS